MHETGRNMHSYSDISSQADCTYSSEHEPPSVITIEVSRIVFTERFISNFSKKI